MQDATTEPLSVPTPTPIQNELPPIQLPTTELPTRSKPINMHMLSMDHMINCYHCRLYLVENMNFFERNQNVCFESCIVTFIIFYILAIITIKIVKVF